MHVLQQLAQNIYRRNKKTLRGLYLTLHGKAVPYDEGTFWDEQIYAQPPKSDGDTIRQGDEIDFSAIYSYATLEAAVSLVLARRQIKCANSMLDLGSGTGHWVDFFLRIFPPIEHVQACDVSAKCCEFIQNRFAADPRIVVNNCSAELFSDDRLYDLVCMIGSAFHVVRDVQMENILRKINVSLRSDGVVILNDLLPWCSHANQFASNGLSYCKFVRSRRRWRKLAAQAHLKVFFVRNYAWLRAPLRRGMTIPEGHLVCLHK